MAEFPIMVAVDQVAETRYTETIMDHSASRTVANLGSTPLVPDIQARSR